MEGLIRILRTPFTILMWIALYWLWSSELLVTPLAVSLVATHLIALILFYHFVYVFNYGYAVTMIALPIGYGLWYDPPFAALVVLAIAILYGLRLLSFTWTRYRSESYAEHAKRATLATGAIPLPVKAIIWLFMGAFLFFVSFNTWVVASGETIDAAVWAGVILMITGLALESIADDQKQRAKRANNNTFCYSGLYTKIRHPNFLGEMVFHVGLYWAMVSATDQVYTLVLGGMGTGWVLILMICQAVDHDKKQQARYGDTGQFADYRRKTGLLWPKIGQERRT